jgi:NADH-quinone oxidoreductase subunit N
VVGVLNSIISIFYYLRVVMAMYFRDPLGEFRPIRSGGMMFVMAVSAILVLAMGLLPSRFLGLL